MAARPVAHPVSWKEGDEQHFAACLFYLFVVRTQLRNVVGAGASAQVTLEDNKGAPSCKVGEAYFAAIRALKDEAGCLFAYNEVLRC